LLFKIARVSSRVNHIFLVTKPALKGSSTLFGMLLFALVQKCSKPSERYIFTDGFGYQPSVLFLVVVP
jgi:pantothenate kinase